MMGYVTGFGASLAFVFFKAFQQRNVAFDHYRWVLPTSMAMAFTEFYVIALIVQEGYNLGLVGAIGLGAGTGAIGAMHLHGKLLGNKHASTGTGLTAQGVTEVRDETTEGEKGDQYSCAMHEGSPCRKVSSTTRPND